MAATRLLIFIKQCNSFVFRLNQQHLFDDRAKQNPTIDSSVETIIRGSSFRRSPGVLVRPVRELGHCQNRTD